VRERGGSSPQYFGLEPPLYLEVKTYNSPEAEMVWTKRGI